MQRKPTTPAAALGQPSPTVPTRSTPSSISGAVAPSLTQEQQALLAAKKEMAEALGFAY